MVRTSDFDYELPTELIAQNPVEPRDAARLMLVDRRTGRIEHHFVRELPGLLTSGDLLVVNDTRVMAARLSGRREGSGGRVEALLIRQTGDRRWDVMFRPARRARPGRTFLFATAAGTVAAVAGERDGEIVSLEFEHPIDPSTVGMIPLPPYITRFEGDPERYQTVFARDAASAAAPTAGLHFTERLLQALARAGVGKTEVSLDIGPGTFRPVSVENPSLHRMHGERFHVGPGAADRIQDALRQGHRIVAVGTTVVRTLEHVHRQAGMISPCTGETNLFLLPGDSFRVTGALLTNFHLPRSTLLMLVAAFAGTELIFEAYRQAIARRYRFYSFGDAMLIV